MKKGKVRIIAGKLKGKQIPVIDSLNLRPSSDRNRETLFNWLMHEIGDSNCLDLFAGSGALGIEAISRGAKKVSFVEKNPRVFKQLKLTTHELENIELFQTDANKFLKSCDEKFDIIFLDPPFKQDLINKFLPLLNKNLKKNSILYIESETKPEISELNLAPLKEKISGQVYFSIWQVKA